MMGLSSDVVDKYQLHFNAYPSNHVAGNGVISVPMLSRLRPLFVSIFMFTNES